MATAIKFNMRGDKNHERKGREEFGSLLYFNFSFTRIYEKKLEVFVCLRFRLVQWTITSGCKSEVAWVLALIWFKKSSFMGEDQR